jgi:hypothetical protein
MGATTSSTAGASTSNLSKLFSYSIIALFIAALVVSVSMAFWSSCNKSKEGFAGPAIGAGLPDCMSSSSDCAKLYELLNSKKVGLEEGTEDLREMNLILSKISCLKRDLLGNAKLVDATRYQPFSTAHDLQPVAEVAAQCFSRTIPQRDLALFLDKWGSRATFLLKRLCTSERLSEEEEKKALTLLGDAMADLNDIAKSECCSGGTPTIAGHPAVRMVGGFVPDKTQGLKEYHGLY